MEVWGCFLISAMRMLYFSKDVWKFIQIHQYYSASQKVYTFQKSPHINISYFQEIFMHVGSYGSYLWTDTKKKSDDIACLSEHEPRLWNWPKSRLDRNWYLFQMASSKIESWNSFEFFIFWWSDNLWTDRLCYVCILTMPLNFHASSSNLVLNW